MRGLDIDPKKKEGESFIRWIEKRTLQLNKNVILLVVGDTGSGKSYTCLRIAEKLAERRGKKYDIKNTCRSLNEFMERINDKNLKKGDVITLEEVGINISSRNWQSQLNKLINFIFQVFRDQNLVILLNLPDIRMVDANIRRLIHGIITMNGIDKSKKQAKIKFKVRQHNHEIHKDYWKFLRVRVNGKQVSIKKIRLNKPSDKLCEIYEKRRKEMADEIRQKNYEMIVKIEEKDQKEDKKLGLGSGRPFTERQEKIARLWNGGMTKIIDIAKELGINPGSVTLNLQYMDRKDTNWRKNPRN